MLQEENVLLNLPPIEKLGIISFLLFLVLPAVIVQIELVIISDKIPHAGVMQVYQVKEIRQL